MVQRVVDHAAETPSTCFRTTSCSCWSARCPRQPVWSRPDPLVCAATPRSFAERCGHRCGARPRAFAGGQDRAITMLRRTRNVLEQLGHLGARKSWTLLFGTPAKALPATAKATHKLIRRALDDIHLEADQRDAGGRLWSERPGVGRTADATRSSGLDCRHAARPASGPSCQAGSPSEARNGLAEAPPVELTRNHPAPAPSPRVEAEVVGETVPRPASAATTAIDDEGSAG